MKEEQLHLKTTIQLLAIVFNNNNEEQKECNLGKKYYIEYMFVTLSFFISSLLKEEEIQR